MEFKVHFIRNREKRLSATSPNLIWPADAKALCSHLDSMRLAFGSKLLASIGLALAASGLSALGQIGGPGGPAGVTAAITKLFGDTRAFTSKAEVQLLDNAQKEIAVMPMDFSMSDSNIRVEMDLTQVKNQQMPPGAIESLKEMGMAHVISIINPGKTNALVLYPDQKILLKVALPKEEAAAAESKEKLKKTPLGNETVDGHPCVKNKVTLADSSGQSVDVTLWNATDLKDFPVQIQTKEQENTSIMRFKEVKLTRPDSGLFEAPADYTQCTSQQELMQAMLKKAGAGSDRK